MWSRLIVLRRKLRTPHTPLKRKLRYFYVAWGSCVNAKLFFLVLFSGVKSARFRPVKEQGGNTSPPLQIKADHQQGRLKHNLREQVQQLSSPRAQRQTRPFIIDEEDKEREQKDQSPEGATQDVIYFW